MTPESMIEVLRAHLSKRGIYLHTASGEKLLGARETRELAEVCELFRDVEDFRDEVTAPISDELLEHILAAKRIA